MNKILLFCIASTLYFFSAQNNANEVSMISLIVNPEKYENMKVIVIGVAAISFEVSKLYLDEWSYTRAVNSNSICLGMDSKQKYEHLNGRDLIVYGTFMKNKYCGYILRIENVGIRQPRITKQ